jgi:hypothetical protein
MLLCSLSTVVLSSVVVPGNISSSAVTMITIPNLPPYGTSMVSALIIFLILKESLLFSQKWNKYINDSFNLVITSFILTFVMIILYDIYAIIGY